MNILHLIRTSEIGGAERVLLHGLPALRAEGAQVLLGVLDPTPGRPNEFIKAAEALDIPTWQVRDPGAFSLPSSMRLGQHLLNKDISLLHVHGYRALAYGLPAARLVGCPIVTTRHGVLSRNLRERCVEQVERSLAHKADAVIAVAPHLALSSARSEVIANGIPLPELATMAKQLPAESIQRLLFVGRLSQEKNVAMLLQVMAMLQATHPELQLDIVGQGPEEESLKALSKALALESSVTFHGFCDPTPFYEACDVVVMASFREGLPLVALEAMAHQRPVVATAVGGLPALIEQEPACGLLAPSADPEAYAACLTRLIQAPGLARTMAERGRARVEETYGLEPWASRHIQLYRELVAPATSWEHSHTDLWAV